jgi:hypothetical protein
MKNLYKIFVVGALLAVSLPVVAKDNNEQIGEKYRRSSICSVLLSQTHQKMADKIQETFLEIPTPDKYNNHDLSVKIISIGHKGQHDNEIDKWVTDNMIASRLVAKWFNRDKFTGVCDMELVKERGLYDASELDKELAARSVRGMQILEDAGEDLIGKTFLLVNEAHYIDNAQRSKNVGAGLRFLGAVADAYTGGHSFSDMADDLGDIAETFKGFRVKIHTRLYQLTWDETTATKFYVDHYCDTPDAARKAAFENARSMYKLQYIGDVESSGSKNSFLGISEEHPEIMIRKACQRAIDDNVRDLQAKYECFRIKAPITDVAGNEIKVQIGMKEGVSESSEYEVLEPEIKNGKTIYHRIAVIAPVKNKIWDNRFMAVEEGAAGSELDATYFSKKSGKDIYPGLLVRQLK